MVFQDVGGAEECWGAVGGVAFLGDGRGEGCGG